MEHTNNILDPESSWTSMQGEAQRWIDQNLGCSSFKERKRYHITGFTKRGAIHIKREGEAKPHNLGKRSVTTYLNRLAQNGTLPTNIHDVDVIVRTVIVNLHQYLSFSDDGDKVIILTKPKLSFPGSRLVNISSSIDKKMAAREIRQGQGEFREAILLAYNNTCCITGTSVISTLDAAHIKPYSVSRDQDSTNGLLLRADIHNLFDDGDIHIDPKSLKITVSKSLLGTEYERYHDSIISKRTDGLRPSIDSLKWIKENLKK